MRIYPRLFGLSIRPSLAGYDPLQATYMAEKCIAVNEKDRIMGSTSKEECHHFDSLKLHRAFSVFAFTPEQKLILQRRSDSKITFPGLWTNTCCSHPLHNAHEMDGALGVQRAAVRKLHHELGIMHIKETECVVLGRYLYKAVMQSSPWGEHELDYGLILRDLPESRLLPNPDEVSDIRIVGPGELQKWMTAEPDSFSPWFSLFVKRGHLQSWWSNLKTLTSPADLPIVQLN